MEAQQRRALHYSYKSRDSQGSHLSRAGQQPWRRLSGVMNKNASYKFHFRPTAKISSTWYAWFVLVSITFPSCPSDLADLTLLWPGWPFFILSLVLGEWHKATWGLRSKATWVMVTTEAIWGLEWIWNNWLNFHYIIDVMWYHHAMSLNHSDIAFTSATFQFSWYSFSQLGNTVLHHVMHHHPLVHTRIQVIILT